MGRGGELRLETMLSTDSDNGGLENVETLRNTTDRAYSRDLLPRRFRPRSIVERPYPRALILTRERHPGCPASTSQHQHRYTGLANGFNPLPSKTLFPFFLASTCCGCFISSRSQRLGGRGFSMARNNSRA